MVSNDYHKYLKVRVMGKAYIYLKGVNAVFFTTVKETPKDTVADNIIYLDSRICRLCKWPAPGLLCASIHYHTKQLMSTLSAFSVLSTKCTSCPLQAGDACSLGDGQMERNVMVELN